MNLSAMLIRLLNPNDAPLFRSLRLQALAEAPTSFASSYEDEVGPSIDVIQKQLMTRDDRGVLALWTECGWSGLRDWGEKIIES